MRAEDANKELEKHVQVSKSIDIECCHEKKKERKKTVNFFHDLNRVQKFMNKNCSPFEHARFFYTIRC